MAKKASCFGLLACSLLLYLGCDSTRKLPPAEHQGGLAISFDDHFVEEWYALAPMFRKHNAKVTFFLTCPAPLSKREVSLLSKLQQRGHEIGYHGTIHGNATQMMEEQGAEVYLGTEIRPGLRYLKNAGFIPTSYAHPGGNHTAMVDSLLLNHKFTILRDVSKSERELYGVTLYHIPPRFLTSIYYTFDNDPTVNALLIDADANINSQEIRDALLKAKNKGTVLMLFGHKPLRGAPRQDEYGFQISFLHYIVEQADSLGLKFYTMSELTTLAASRPKDFSL